MKLSNAAVAVALLVAGALPARAQELKGSGTVVLRAARVIDGTGAAPIMNGMVVVTDDRIVAVGKQGSVTIPAGARVVDLGDATLLPGFIDAHTHTMEHPSFVMKNGYVYKSQSVTPVLP